MTGGESALKRTRLGFWLQSDNPRACDVACSAGYDFVVFDMEHGSLDLPAIDNLVSLSLALGLTPCVRVAEATRSHIQHALDVGASVVILPQIEDADQAREVTRYAKYPPLGSRGLGYSRTEDCSGPPDAVIARENERRWCFPMIETAGAFADMAEIMSLPCVDGVFVGPSDLSLSRGRGMFSASQADIDDLRSIATCAGEAGKRWGAAAANRKYRNEASKLGATFVAVADDLSALDVGFRALLHGR